MGLVTEVDPPAVPPSVITVATQEASVMFNWTFFGEMSRKIKELNLAANVLVSLVSAAEQQSHHDVVAEAVLQRRGEQRVADHAEVAVHVCAVGEQQPHKVVPANGTRRHTQASVPA